MTEDGWCATGFSAKLIVDKLEAFEYQNRVRVSYLLKTLLSLNGKRAAWTFSETSPFVSIGRETAIWV